MVSAGRRKTVGTKDPTATGSSWAQTFTDQPSPRPSPQPVHCRPISFGRPIVVDLREVGGPSHANPATCRP